MKIEGKKPERPPQMGKQLSKKDSHQTFAEVNSRADKNVIIVDTNVIIQDPDLIPSLQKGGNLVVIPWQVILELDGLKKDYDVGPEARRAIKNIHAQQLGGKSNLIIERKTRPHKDLEKNKPDHKIIATVFHILQSRHNPTSPYLGYGKIKLISNDYGMQVFAKEVGEQQGLIVEFYKNDQTKLGKKDLELKKIKISFAGIRTDQSGNIRYYTLPRLSRIPNNGAVIIYTDADHYAKPFCAGVRRRERLILLDNDISISGIKSLDFEQKIAMHYILDPEIKCVFLQGRAGTGKTLLALAGALRLQQRGEYEQIVVSRPVVSLKDENMGFIPGDIESKYAPWLRPIFDNLAFLSGTGKSPVVETNESTKPLESARQRKLREKREAREERMNGKAKGSKSHVKVKTANESKRKMPTLGVDGIKLMEERGISILPLTNIRGSSISGTVIIVDESQQITPAKMKTIITRAAAGTKLIFTGDLEQIDTPGLTKESSGLSYVITKLRGYDLIGIVNLKKVYRSPLAELAARVL